MKKFKLGNNLEIPAIGFGTWQIEGDICISAVETAIEVGYRHLDCAAAYNNHTLVANGIKNSGIKREELFITSKVWLSDIRSNKVIEACKRALDEMNTSYFDLYLMHWPDKNTPMEETLGDLVELKNEGIIKEWGVSNCTIHHLQDMFAKGYTPANNQVEFHPSLNQAELKDFCDKNSILLTAYSPIAQGADLKLPLIMELADKYKKSSSQVILNWLISKGIVAIPKASSRDHIEDNFKTLEWELSLEDINRINQLNTNNRVIVPDWAEFDY